MRPSPDESDKNSERLPPALPIKASLCCRVVEPFVNNGACGHTSSQEGVGCEFHHARRTADESDDACGLRSFERLGDILLL